MISELLSVCLRVIQTVGIASLFASTVLAASAVSIPLSYNVKDNSCFHIAPIDVQIEFSKAVGPDRIIAVVQLSDSSSLGSSGSIISVGYGRWNVNGLTDQQLLDDRTKCFLRYTKTGKFSMHDSLIKPDREICISTRLCAAILRRLLDAGLKLTYGSPSGVLDGNLGCSFAVYVRNLGPMVGYSVLDCSELKRVKDPVFRLQERMLAMLLSDEKQDAASNEQKLVDELSRELKAIGE